MGTAYKYSSLGDDEIRLINLAPGEGDARLECTISIVKQHSKTAYEAVSYVWGNNDNSHDPHNLLIHLPSTDEKKKPESRFFLLQENLTTALKHFRHPKDNRMLWCDAICIDQNNENEKSRQVPLMEMIYGHATRVLVWLGEETSYSTAAIDFMKEIVNLDDFDDYVTGKNKRHAESWDALQQLIRMPWFTRRWVLQEIALAKQAQIHCGNSKISWKMFCDAVALFEKHEQLIRPQFMHEQFKFAYRHLGEVQALGACRLVRATRNLFRKTDGVIQKRLVSLESLVSMLTMFDATNPHDTIYGVLALAKDIKTVAQQSWSVDKDAAEVHSPPKEDETLPRGVKRKVSDTTRYRFRKAARVSRVTQSPRSGAPRSAAIGDLLPYASSGPKFPVDYSKSFFEVCQDFVSFAITQSKSLDIICRPWVPKCMKWDSENQAILPSWLIGVGSGPFRPKTDGSYTRVNADPLVGQHAMEAKRYNACGWWDAPRRMGDADGEVEKHHYTSWGFGLLDTPSQFDDNRSLFVGGMVFGVIAELEDKALGGTIPSSWFTFAGWRDHSELPPDPLWRTLVADRNSEGQNPEQYWDTALQKHVQKHVPDDGDFAISKVLERPQYNSVVEDVLGRVQAVTLNRRLFKTDRGSGRLLGLAPEKAREGDLICILFGCSVPVVLHRHIDDHLKLEHFELIGEAYVHGIMDGEAMTDTAGAARVARDKRHFEIR